MYITWVTYSTLNLVVGGTTLEHYSMVAEDLSTYNVSRYSGWTTKRVKEGAPIKHWLGLGRFKTIMYGIMAFFNIAVVVMKDSPTITRWWFEWFMWCSLEPFISFIWAIISFKSYEDCRDVVPYTASDVMCLDGSNNNYGKNGWIIAGGNDSERRVYFWSNIFTSLITMGVHGALFEGSMEEHD